MTRTCIKVGRFLRLLLLQGGVAALSVLLLSGAPAWAKDGDDIDEGMVVKTDTIAAQLGGFPGIYAFLKNTVPVLLADREIASFFRHLSESPDDIE